MIKGAVHNFQHSKTNLLHRLSLLKLKQNNTKSLLFVNTDVRNLLNERTLLPQKEEVKDLAFKKK